jgi:inner membrane protein
VDSLLHAALGAVVGEVFLGKKLGNRALAWGALLGSLPDVDVVVSPFLDTAGRLDSHRGQAHSLLFLVVIPFLLAPWLAKLWKKDKVSQNHAGWFVFVSLAVHILMDCFTTYGTKVFAPFSHYPVSFNSLFIIDPFLWGVTLVTVAWLAFLKKKDPKRLRLAKKGLLITVIYLALAVGAKFWTSFGFEKDLAQRDAKFLRRMEAPTAFNIFLWRSVVDRGDEFWIGYKSVFELPGTPVRWEVIPKQPEAFAKLRDEREGKAIQRFSSNWWIARPTAKGAWVADLRFSEIRSWQRESFVDLRPGFSWEFSINDPQDRLRLIIPERSGAGDILKRMGMRIVGFREPWEGSPRLTGNPGSLPESIGWMER